MDLETNKYWTDCGEKHLLFNRETGWREIHKGLKLVVQGYIVLIAGTVLGAVLVWLAVDGRLVAQQPQEGQQDRTALLLLGVLALGLTAVFSYGLVLTGQWRCLMYAPQTQNAKELMYVCINCIVIGSLLNVAGVYLDGGRTYAALQQGVGGLEQIDLLSTGNLIQLASGALGVFGSLVFSQFLRNLASCFNDRARVRSVDLNLVLVGLLLGGSIGTMFLVPRLAPRAELLPWLAGGWLVCFAWHLWLVRSVRRCVADGLERTLAQTGAPAPEANPVALYTRSGLHRLIRKASF
jgi:hypothetical protein